MNWPKSNFQKVSILKLAILLTISFNQFANCLICQSQGKTSSNEPCFDTTSFEYNANKRVQQDKKVELECLVKNKGDFSIAWLYEKQIISLNSMILKPTPNLKLNTNSKNKFNLEISNVHHTQNGTYTCQIISSGTNNLDYKLDVLVPPSISRMPAEEKIVLREGQSITVQCLTQGNPKPKLAWSKRGEKAEHTTIDETKSTLSLTNVDESHSDSYTCTAKNGVGDPVTSEFQILVKYKPKLAFSEQENINSSVMYTAVGKKEVITCRVNAYPQPRVSLLYNDQHISPDLYQLEENKNVPRQYVLTYSFVGSSQTFGAYKCLAENEMGSNSVQMKVSAMPSEVTINNEKLPLYSDAVIFEWSVYSGSGIQELDVHIVQPQSNNTNGTHIYSKTKQTLPDGTESQPTYHNDVILYKDFYDVPKLHSNSSYLVRVRVKNDMQVWSEYSNQLTLKTHWDENEKLTKHRSFNLHHHRHHDKKHKNYLQSGSRDLNSRGRYGNGFMDENGAEITKFSCSILSINFLISFLFFY